MKLIQNILVLQLLISVILCACPSGWANYSTNTSKYDQCQLPRTYGRGVGYKWQFGDRLNLNAARKRCEKDNPVLGCEQWGAVIYPKCRENYKFWGCCLCMAYCPSGFYEQADGTCYRKL